MNKEIYKKYLENILLSQNVTDTLRENLDQLLIIIPEIKPMINFKHNHPHHHLDVWEHTLCALSFSPNNFDIRLALLLHDIGKPHSFQEEGEIRHFRGHAEKSANITKEILNRLNYSQTFIDNICKIVLLHDLPLTNKQICENLTLSKIIFEVQKCDTWAHNPNKNEHRLAYIKETLKKFKN